VSQHDDDLHDARISALYRTLPDAEPAADTDALIRAAARRAVLAGPRSARFAFASKRLLATAATLLLGVGMVLQLQRHAPQEFEDALAVRKTPAVQAAAEAAAPVVTANAAPAVAAPAEKRRARPAEAAESDVAAEALAEPEVDNLATAAAPVPAAPAASAGAMAMPPAESTAMESAPRIGAAGASAPAGAEFESARAAGDAARVVAKRAAQAAERKLALRAEQAAAAAEPAPSYAPTHAQKAEAADQASSPPADYRELMATGRHAEALQLLTTAATTTAILDRDLLQLALGHRITPACSRLSTDTLGNEKLLCSYLQAHARGEPLPADWQRQLEQQGLTTGASLYRRRAAEMLFTQ
jgi:hypothetical protein